MADLIARTRELTGETSVLTDDQHQAALDETKQHVRYAVLKTLPVYGPAGAVSYTDFYSPWRNWESDASFVSGGTYAELTPTDGDWIDGKWTFGTSQPWPVLITGATYDTYAAAARLCRQLAARYAIEVNVASDGQSFAAGDLQGHYLALAAEYDRKVRIRRVNLNRHGA